MALVMRVKHEMVEWLLENSVLAKKCSQFKQYNFN